MFVSLSKIGLVSLGYKSLQNDFFYINQATIDTFGIEGRYLLPVLKLRDMTSGAYQQKVDASLWLFNCKDKKADLRGTGALRYIETMADRSAAQKKQTGKPQTIREVLEAQAGGVWYAPKATPHRHHVWLRKAMDGVFSPFLFGAPTLVDQRCNSVAPVTGVTWQELAAVLTSTLFSYSLEINGSASLGAGALEASTTKLRDFPVLDVVQLSPKDRTQLVALATTVWTSETPIDWTGSNRPAAHLRALDTWLLQKSGRTTKIDVVYSDLGDVCRARIGIAKDRKKTSKKKTTDNIGNVAGSIVSTVAPRLQMKSFPNDFVDGAHLDLSFSVDLRSIRQIVIDPLLDQASVQLLMVGGEVAYQGDHPKSVSEAIVRCVLLGRTVFSVSSNRSVMDKAITKCLVWLHDIEQDIAAAIAESSLGTGYEETLRREVYRRLGIHMLAGSKTLPARIAITAES